MVSLFGYIQDAGNLDLLVGIFNNNFIQGEFIPIFTMDISDTEALRFDWHRYLPLIGVYILIYSLKAQVCSLLNKFNGYNGISY